MTNRTNAYIVIVAGIGLLSCATIVVLSPGTAAGQVPIVLAFTGSVIAGLQKSKETDHKATQAAEAAQQAVVVAQESVTQTIETGEKAQNGIDEIHHIVNSQRTEMARVISELQKELAAVRTALAVERSATGGDSTPK